MYNVIVFRQLELAVTRTDHPRIVNIVKNNIVVEICLLKNIYIIISYKCKRT